jgi:hypothetical protein
MSNIIKRHIDNRKLLLICILLLSHSLIFFRFYFFYQYMVVFLFNTVIGVFLLLGLCILIVRLPWPRFFRVFPTCKAMPGYNSPRRGTARTLPIFLCRSMYCLFVSFCVLFVCKRVLYCCHRVFVCKRVLYYCHRVFVCKRVLYCCHRVATQLQLTNTCI